MPLLERMDRYEKAVLWSRTGVDRYNEPVLSTPVEVMVRWVPTNKEAVTPQGETVGLDANVVVDLDVAFGSHLWRGSLDDWYGTGSGDVGGDVMEVKTISSADDIKGRSTRRTLGLSRYKSAAPGVS
jgi:hypothetical protein